MKTPRELAWALLVAAVSITGAIAFLQLALHK